MRRSIIAAAAAAAAVLAAAACGGGASSGGGGHSDSYNEGHAAGSGFKDAEAMDAKQMCGLLSASHLPDDEDDWLKGCIDAMRADGAS
jgi:hypothetical protein